MALPLPGGDRVELYVDAVFSPIDGVKVYTGPVDGRPEWLFTLAVESEQILGRFFIGNRVWILENFDAPGRLKLHRMERTLLPKVPDTDMLQSSVLSLSSTTETAVTTQTSTPPSCANFTPTNANGNVRILFLHSSDVATGIDNLVASIVAEFNYSIDASRVELNNFITVADIRQVNETFDGLCRQPILDQMKFESGVFQGLPQWMTSTNADLAFIVVNEDPDAEEGGACVSGLGRVGGAAWVLKVAGNPAYGLATRNWALGDLTALHEIGHILGGLHEYQTEISDVEAQAGVPDCARGLAGASKDWMTIMGGYGPATCPFDENQPDPTQQSCTRLPIWSNAFTFHDGEPVGSIDANMGIALQMTMPTAAGWDAFPTPKPQAAPNASVLPGFCLGFNDIFWSAVASAEVYQLVESVNSGFSFDPLEFFGADTGHFVNIPQGQTRYYRVRGCNGSGCGPWSNTVSASYFNGCQ